VNAVPQHGKFLSYRWYQGAQDHTENDTDGYMYLVSVGASNTPLFQSTVNNLSIGLCYEFSVYLTNPVQQLAIPIPKPNIQLEVRTATNENQLLAQFSTGDILEYGEMTWSKHGLSFTASSTSVVLLILSNTVRGTGNDVAIDDIELRVYPPG
jgi:hypothetical protein